MSRFDYKSVTIPQAAAALGVRINTSGNSRCINPSAHKNGDRKPSFSVSSDGRLFKCFGCGIKGNVWEFVKIVKNVNDKEAIRWLRENFGDSVSNNPKFNPKVANTGNQQFPEQKFINPDFIQMQQAHLDENVFAGTLMNLGIPRSHLLKWNVAHDHDGPTMFCYMDLKERIVNIKRIKYLSDLHRDKNIVPKLLGKARGYYSCLYGEHLLPESDMSLPLRLVESEKTAILGSYIDPANIWLATGGASLMTSAKAKVLEGRTVTILCDADAAGRLNAEKTRKILLQNGASAQVVDLYRGVDDGRDIADDILEGLMKNTNRI